MVAVDGIVPGLEQNGEVQTAAELAWMPLSLLQIFLHFQP